MSAKKTKYGTVERPPTMKNDTALDEWQEAIDSALTVAKKAQEREAALRSVTTTDTNRFPIMKGQ